MHLIHIKALLEYTTAVSSSCYTRPGGGQTRFYTEQHQHYCGIDMLSNEIRRAGGWDETGVVEGSHPLSFFDAQGRYDAAAWMAELSKVAGPGDPMVLICRSGHRTGVVSRFLEERAGYQAVHDVTGGIKQWISNGRPTVTPDSP